MFALFWRVVKLLGAALAYLEPILFVTAIPPGGANLLRILYALQFFFLDPNNSLRVRGSRPMLVVDPCTQGIVL